MKNSIEQLQASLSWLKDGGGIAHDRLIAIVEDAVELHYERDRLLDCNLRQQTENEHLTELLNTPLNHDWFQGVQREIGHQLQRWASEHDSGKTPADWFWLIGYLAQKAMMAQIAGDTDKAVHHTITTGAALFHWHRSITGENTQMRPGIAAPEGGDL